MRWIIVPSSLNSTLYREPLLFRRVREVGRFPVLLLNHSDQVVIYIPSNSIDKELKSLKNSSKISIRQISHLTGETLSKMGSKYKENTF
jgi:hypothetical protein